MRINLTLQQLEAFVEVARTVNFRAAAQALHVSQPALSRTIKVIENAIDTRLFDRNTRLVELTPAGRELLPIATRILENFNSSFSELSQFLEGRSGHLTTIALPSAGVAILPDAIAAFCERFPKVQFSLLEGAAEVVRTTVYEGLADFGISVRPAAQEPLHYRHLFDDPFVLVCRRDDPLAARSSVSWSAFASRPFIAGNAKSSIRPITDAAFLQRGLHIAPALEYPSIAAGGALVAAGLGLTALPQLALQLLQNDALVAVPLQRPALSRAIGLVTRAGRSMSPVARAFMESLQASAKTS